LLVGEARLFAGVIHLQQTRLPILAIFRAVSIGILQLCLMEDGIELEKISAKLLQKQHEPSYVKDNLAF
jgi:hypothetical protein